MCDVILHLYCGCDFCCDYLNIFDAIFVLAFAIIYAIFDYFDFSRNFEFSCFTNRHVRAKTA